MYSNGYLTKSECTKAKAKILNLTNASGMCDHINVIAKKEFSNKTYNWAAEVGHPTTNQILQLQKYQLLQKLEQLHWENVMIM